MFLFRYSLIEATNKLYKFCIVFVQISEAIENIKSKQVAWSNLSPSCFILKMFYNIFIEAIYKF
jgi:hypothetical protein